MKQAIITIHGIHTNDLSTWQDGFRFFCKNAHPEVKIFQYEYGFLVGPFAWWATLTERLNLPTWLRRRIVNQFAKYVIDLQKKFPDYEFSILAHSFGTWISYYMMKAFNEINLKNLVLVGGVISEHQEKLQIINWIESGRLKSVHAFWSHSDEVVKNIAIEPFGKLGYYGFVRNGMVQDYIKPQPQPYAPYPVFNWPHEGHGGALKIFPTYGNTLVNCLLQ